jgi:hypothetical protein
MDFCRRADIDPSQMHAVRLGMVAEAVARCADELEAVTNRPFPGSEVNADPSMLRDFAGGYAYIQDAAVREMGLDPEQFKLVPRYGTSWRAVPVPFTSGYAKQRND